MINNAGNVNMPQGNIIQPIFNVLVPRIFDMIIKAQNIPTNNEYILVFVRFSNINNQYP